MADQDKTCSKLGLCPKVPDWINQRVSDSEVHYNEDDEDDDGDNYDNFSILPNFRGRSNIKKKEMAKIKFFLFRRW